MLRVGGFCILSGPVSLTAFGGLFLNGSNGVIDYSVSFFSHSGITCRAYHIVQ